MLKRYTNLRIFYTKDCQHFDAVRTNIAKHKSKFSLVRWCHYTKRNRNSVSGCMRWSISGMRKIRTKWAWTQWKSNKEASAVRRCNGRQKYCPSRATSCYREPELRWPHFRKRRNWAGIRNLWNLYRYQPPPSRWIQFWADQISPTVDFESSKVK